MTKESAVAEKSDTDKPETKTSTSKVGTVWTVSAPEPKKGAPSRVEFTGPNGAMTVAARDGKASVVLSAAGDWSASDGSTVTAK